MWPIQNLNPVESIGVAQPSGRRRKRLVRQTYAALAAVVLGNFTFVTSANERQLLVAAGSEPEPVTKGNTRDEAGQTADCALPQAKPTGVPKRSGAPTAPQNLTVSCGQYSSQQVVYENPSTTEGKSTASSIWLNALVRLVEALVWPIVAALALFKFADAIEQLLRRMSNLKVADKVSITFDEEVANLRDDAEESGVAQPRSTTAPAQNENALVALARTSPRAAIIESWRLLHRVAWHAVGGRVSKALAQKLFSDALEQARIAKLEGELGLRVQRTPTFQLAYDRELLASGLLKPDDVLVFNQLRSLRNRASHDDGLEISFEAANDFIHVAEALKRKIEKESERK